MFRIDLFIVNLRFLQGQSQSHWSLLAHEILSDHASTSLACHHNASIASSASPAFCLRRPASIVPSSTSHQHNSAAMSSIINGISRSDTAQLDTRSDAQSIRSTNRRTARSSSRPRGPPSVSTPGPQSDAGLYPDDEIVGARGARRQLTGANVNKVVDTTAEALASRFEQFLEEYGRFTALINETDICVDSQKIPLLPVYRCQAQ